LRSTVSIYNLSDDGNKIAFMNLKEGGGYYYTTLNLQNFSVQDVTIPACDKT